MLVCEDMVVDDRELSRTGDEGVDKSDWVV